jgi:hypothetical protein
MEVRGRIRKNPEGSGNIRKDYAINGNLFLFWKKLELFGNNRHKTEIMILFGKPQSVGFLKIP